MISSWRCSKTPAEKASFGLCQICVSESLGLLGAGLLAAGTQLLVGSPDIFIRRAAVRLNERARVHSKCEIGEKRKEEKDACEKATRIFGATCVSTVRLGSYARAFPVIVGQAFPLATRQGLATAAGDAPALQ
jgi:hypothetical protein